MGENKGKGMKGRNYDEISGVGTSVAGVTGTTGKLNDGVRDGGVGKPAAADSGNLNRQSAEPNDGDTTPALGTGNRSGAGESRQGAPGDPNSQSGQGGNLQGGKSLDQDVLGKEN
ncbi:hypothetical protein G4G28_13125 [Massilia sp. Dwa41.01b]|uniref:hypothetical protein n=1 Tax=Massilia sp. Dwa41.01b TaxID=2709302 RepID=UPI0016008BC2|nr:hypothetical protein [Massilia sp. Dwa41.01b]QNA89172.1 hypothetical protein G4G28_13125 [Massilia sp. Dwa41.01b]